MNFSELSGLQKLSTLLEQVHALPSQENSLSLSFYQFDQILSPLPSLSRVLLLKIHSNLKLEFRSLPDCVISVNVNSQNSIDIFYSIKSFSVEAVLNFCQKWSILQPCLQLCVVAFSQSLLQELINNKGMIMFERVLQHKFNIKSQETQVLLDQLQQFAKLQEIFFFSDQISMESPLPEVIASALCSSFQQDYALLCLRKWGFVIGCLQPANTNSKQILLLYYKQGVPCEASRLMHITNSIIANKVRLVKSDQSVVMLEQKSRIKREHQLRLVLLVNVYSYQQNQQLQRTLPECLAKLLSQSQNCDRHAGNWGRYMEWSKIVEERLGLQSGLLQESILLGNEI